jgi:hypothetical protein
MFVSAICFLAFLFPADVLSADLCVGVVSFGGFVAQRLLSAYSCMANPNFRKCCSEQASSA